MAGTGPAARRNFALVGGAVLLVVAAYLGLLADPARAGIWAVGGIAAAVVVLLHTARADDSLPGWLLAAGIALLTVGQAVTAGRLRLAVVRRRAPPARLPRDGRAPSPPSSATGSGTTATACSTRWWSRSPPPRPAGSC